MNTSQSMNNQSDEQSEAALFNYIINVYVDGLLCLFGFFGNIMILVVLRRNKTQTSNSILLQGLAAYDMCFLCYVVFYVVLRSLHAYTACMPWLDVASPYIVAFVLPFGWTAQTCTIWMVMMVTVDRYWIVSKPLTGFIRCNPTIARYMTAGVAVTAILFNVVRWPRYYFIAFHSDSNSTFVSHIGAKIEGWDDDLYLIIYHITLTFFCLFIIPLGVIISLNIRLAVFLKRATKSHNNLVHRTQADHQQHQKHGSLSAPSMNLTRMLVIMITVFVLCELPDFIAGIIGAGKFKVNQTVYKYYAAIKEAMLVFNSSINFYLYLLLYRSFRVAMYELFGLKKKKERPNQGMLTATSSLASEINTIAKSTVTLCQKEYVNEKGYNTRL